MNFLVHLIGLAWKQVSRHRIRSLLTIAGVAAGMFLFTAVETMQSSLRVATESSVSMTCPRSSPTANSPTVSA